MDNSQLIAAPDLSQLAIDLYHNSVQGATVRASELLIQSRRVSRWLFTVACGQTAVMMIVLLILSVTKRPQILPLIKISAIVAICQAVLFWAMWAWSKSSPLPPAIAALTIHMTTWYAGAAYQYAAIAKKFSVEEADRQAGPDASTIIKFAIAIALIRTVIAGVKYQKITKHLAAAGSESNDLALPLTKTSDRRIAGVATSIALFFALLYIKGTITVLSGTGELTPLVYRQMLGVFATIVLVWSVASWRDVYRPLTKTLNPAWYFAAIGLGFVTFSIAHVWMNFVQHWVNLPHLAPAQDEYSGDMMMQLLLVCANPAICEEIAFRGVMFAGFSRTLRGWETVVLTALMFMVLHVNPPAYPHLLIMGFVLGVMRLKTGSWLPGVFLHFTHNFLAVVANQTL